MKQVIVVDESLGLPRGKLAVQVAHASIAAFLSAPAQAQSAWVAGGMAKVVLACASAAELLEIHHRAIGTSLCAELIRDAGLTVVLPGTPTCVAIGPAEDVSIDLVTGSLRLVR